MSDEHPHEENIACCGSFFIKTDYSPVNTSGFVMLSGGIEI